jgi:hypothetical protein
MHIIRESETPDAVVNVHTLQDLETADTVIKEHTTTSDNVHIIRAFETAHRRAHDIGVPETADKMATLRNIREPETAGAQHQKHLKLQTL